MTLYISTFKVLNKGFPKSIDIFPQFDTEID